MSISFPTPPPHVTRAIETPFTSPHGTTFHSSHTPSGMRTLAARGAQPSAPVRPHREYTIPTEALLSANPLAAAKERGWRSLETAENGTPGARLVAAKSATQASVVQFNVGPFTAATAQAMQRLQRSAPADPCEFRFLVLPQIYVAAIWLHGTRDLFLPLAPAPSQMPTSEILPAEAFFAIVRQIAQARSTLPPPPKDPQP